MGSVEDVKASIQATLDHAARSDESETSEHYDDLDALAETLDGKAREAIQSKLDTTSLLQKLKEQTPLTPADWKTLETLIVGDAESFLKYETDLPRWKEEIHRLVGELGDLHGALDVDGLLHLRALCQELRRVLPEVVFYFDKKERVEKFQAASQAPLDADGYRFLAGMVSAMMSSDRM